MESVDYRKFITFQPSIRFGKPSIVGTRITVPDILNWLKSGMSEEEILFDFPELKWEHIDAVRQFASKKESILEIITL